MEIVGTANTNIYLIFIWLLHSRHSPCPDPLHLPVDPDEAQDPDEADPAGTADDGQDDVGPVETDGVINHKIIVKS